MLSRNAERVYWLGRYMERTEDTARLLNAFSHVMMDLPESSKLGWKVLLQIMSVEEQFKKRHGDDTSEEKVISFFGYGLREPRLHTISNSRCQRKRSDRARQIATRRLGNTE